MQEAPLISFVVTYYSYADYLLEAVASVAAQTYKNFEVIIVDDGSPEKHVTELNFGQLDFPLKIVTHETNKGLPEARNTGVKHASGELLVIMDSDDLIEPTFLQETLSVLQATGKDGVYTQMQLFGVRNFVWDGEISLVSLLAGEPGPVTFLMKRHVFEAVGGYNQTLPINSDHEFWVAALAQGMQFARVEKPLFKYRKHESSLSQHYRENWWQSIPVLLEHHREIYDAHYPEVMAYKERQFRKLEQQYDELYQQWQEVDGEARRINAVHNEAMKRAEFAEEVFKNPLLRLLFFVLRRLPDSKYRITMDEDMVTTMRDRPEEGSAGLVGDTRHVLAP